MPATDLSFFNLFKQTCLFFTDLKRLWRLCAIPAAALFALAVLTTISPASLTSSAERGTSLGFVMIGAFFLLFLAVLSIVMVQTHRLAAGAVPPAERERFFPLRMKRAEALYLWNVVKISLLSVLFSVLLSALILAAIQYFAPQILIPLPYVAAFLLVWMPFFMVNLFAFLPAAALGETMPFKKAAGMLQGIRLPFCSLYMITAAVFFITAMIAGAMVSIVLPSGMFSLFVSFCFLEAGVLFSAVAQAVLMTYAYFSLK